MARVPCRNCHSLDHSPALCLSRQRPSTNIARAQSPQRSSGRTVTIDTNINIAQTANGLPTFTAFIKGEPGHKIPVLGLIDSGSQRSFIKRRIAHGAAKENEEIEEIRINTFGSTKAQIEITKSYDIWLITQTGDEIKLRTTEMEFLAKATPKTHSAIREVLTQRGENLADDRRDHDQGDGEFELVIGCDYYWHLLSHETLQGADDSVACASKLGWIIFGSPGENRQTTALTTTTDPSRAMVDFKEFWTLEHMGVTPSEAEDPSFLQTYQHSIKRDSSGRYEVLFPFKDNRRAMESNKGIALARLNSLLKRMKGEDRRSYHEIFQQYLEKGYIEEADGSYTGICTYLPHRPVIKQEATSTKIRPVFDGSAHLHGRPSLNDLLETGPNLNPELLAVLLRFRRHKISWMADITQAFLQIGIQEDHGQIVRFLWVRNPDEDPVKLIEYRWKRVPFGLSSSPFILRAVILKCLDDSGSGYPDLVNQLREQVYVDDWLGGADSVQQAAQLITQAIHLFSTAKMELRKSNTNCKELSKELSNMEFQNELINVGQNPGATIKALGVAWDPSTDTFQFNAQKILEEAGKLDNRPSKRKLFSLALRVFDPMGLISPVTVIAKIIMQKIWAEKIGWDDPVPAKIIPHWETFIKGLADLADTKIERWIGPETQRLHLFCDASDDAYSVAAYIQNGAQTRLLCSKTRIAPDPKKSVSTPRLELLSNLLAARLGKYIETALATPFEKILWTDSSIAYWWIKGESGRWKQFVHNRVSEIRETIEAENVRHCPGTQNPADIASRGAAVNALNKTIGWWFGPQWLTDCSRWPTGPNSPDPDRIKDIHKEEKPKEVTVSTATTENRWYENHSRLRSITRIWATVRRAITRFRGKESPVSTTAKVAFGQAFPMLTVDEVEIVELDLWRETQRDTFAEVRKALRKNLAPRHEKLRKLGLVWDDKARLIRCVGRHQNWLQYNHKPAVILLPEDHFLTKKLVEQTHERLQHTGVNTTMLEIRRSFWIPRLRQTVKKELRRCVRCQRLDARAFNEIPGPLPLDRLQMSNPFEVTGVDFAGPFPLTGPAVNHEEKGYICLFTCAVTRAVHLELTTGQDTTTFINAIRRFFARREVPKVMYSDNARTFTQAARYLRASYRSERVYNTLLDLKVKWRFSPSLAPWWGGFWEIMVQTVKKLIYKTFGNERLSYDVFQTVLTEIENTINLRPLTYVSDDDDEPLTPKQLISGHRQKQKHPVDEEEREYSTRTAITQRELKRRKLLGIWWENFYKEYVADLEKFHCPSPRSTKSVEVGQVVLIHDDHCKRSKWKTGRVAKIYPSSDGKIRRVAVLIANKSTGVGSTPIYRDMKTLFPLELHAGQIDNDPSNIDPFPSDQNPISESESDSDLDSGPTGGVSEILTANSQTTGQDGTWSRNSNPDDGGHQDLRRKKPV
ncbi:uncharacterized protein LOC130691034 [Daphnia carinata]|uniref:uncharacterized protein LOC130691034 n=1 Tax=Daphnia carinata TaxID=120202 RepID=UPI00257B24D3|nr:uncharacterized protein LOC130691034 [Daphnia carinata]